MSERILIVNADDFGLSLNRHGQVLAGTGDPDTFAAAHSTWWTRPESSSTPMCAFIPKCHWLPFFV